MKIYRALIPAILILGMLALPTSSFAAVSVGISVGTAPPPLPIYEQPPIPGYGYIWTPGYWAYGPNGYYWVPGTWVVPPAIGFLWTPPWWGWSNGAYLWHAGYWGPHVGFYGGINYGFGYFGSGYQGGYWNRGRFFYNREVNNIRGRRIRNIYSRPVTQGPENHVSFYGGTGGSTAQASAQERAAARERHLRSTGSQAQHFNAARSNRSLLSTTNNGQPPIAATSRAGRFNNTGVVTGTPGRTLRTEPRRQTGTHRTGPGGPPHVMNQAARHGGHSQAQSHNRRTHISGHRTRRTPRGSQSHRRGA